MFKDRRFLLGLGSGLIVGAILLQLMNVAASGNEPFTLSDADDETDSGQVLTVSELKSMAEHLGYKVYELDEKLYTQMEVDELVRAAVEAKDDQTEPTADAEVPQQSEQPELTEENSQAVVYSITITQGMRSDQVADALLSAKLIDDVEAFKDELSERKLESRIQIGTFVFEKKPSIEEIIAKITRQ